MAKAPTHFFPKRRPGTHTPCHTLSSGLGGKGRVPLLGKRKTSWVVVVFSQTCPQTCDNSKATQQKTVCVAGFFLLKRVRKLAVTQQRTTFFSDATLFPPHLIFSIFNNDKKTEGLFCCLRCFRVALSDTRLLLRFCIGFAFCSIPRRSPKVGFFLNKKKRVF